MQQVKLKVISGDIECSFEDCVNKYLSDLDSLGLSYELSINTLTTGKHCAYITYSAPKLKIPVLDTGKQTHCFRDCLNAVLKSDCTSWCTYHKREIKYGGYCCLEYYEGGL